MMSSATTAEEAGDDEARPAGHLSDKHNGGEWNTVAGAEECRDTDHGKQRGIEGVDRSADDSPDEGTGDDEWNEQAADAAAGNSCSSCEATKHKDRGTSGRCATGRVPSGSCRIPDRS